MQKTMRVKNVSVIKKKKKPKLKLVMFILRKPEKAQNAQYKKKKRYSGWLH
jgi:hypothetical protein